MPLAALTLAAIVFVVWKLNAPGQQFVPAFTRLLADPVIQRGAFSVFSGRSYATGTFKGRDVAIRLQLSRHQHEPGYLVIAVRTNGPATLDYNGIEAHTRDDAGRQALFTIARHDLLLSVEQGWLKTMWKPVGFVVFPGRFSEEKWKPVLEAMQAVAMSLEERSA